MNNCKEKGEFVKIGLIDLIRLKTNFKFLMNWNSNRVRRL